MRPLLSLATTILSTTFAFAAFAQAPGAPPRNVVLFVADGLRFRMVDERTAPTMAAIAREGVSLRNSHALFTDLYHRERLGDGDRLQAGRHRRFLQHDLLRFRSSQRRR